MSQLQEANWLRRAWRTLWSQIDSVVYTFVIIAYEVFFQVANVTIISGSVANRLFARIQIIFGILAMFRIAISIINGIINPDTFMDKEKGFSKIITRIIVVVSVLALIIPTNVAVSEDSSSYTKSISNHGLLFGTLYEAQKYVLQQNVIWKIIFGEKATNTEGEEVALDTLSSQAEMTANSIYKSFMTVNLIEPGADESDPDSWACKDKFQEGELEVYANPFSDIYEAVELSTEYCDLKTGYGGNVFHFAFLPILPTLAGAFVLIMICGFTLDVGIRAIKLAILRLIAPIPIISYIDPKKENNMLSSWVKVTLLTYADLFLRLLIIYFAIFLVQQIALNGLGIGKELEGDAFVNAITRVVVILAIFFFARQAPKFIKDALGIKSLGMSNVGLSGLLGGLGTLAAGGGFSKAFSNAAQASHAATTAAAEGKTYSPFSDAYAGYRDHTMQQITGDKNRRGGLLGRLDQASGRMMAAKYGLSDKNLSAAKQNMINAKNEAARDREVYEQQKAKLESMGLSMGFANNSSRNAYNNLHSARSTFNSDRFNALQRQRDEAANQLRLVAQTYGENSAEYRNANREFSNDWLDDGAKLKELQEQATAYRTINDSRSVIMREQGFTDEAQLNQFLTTNEAYDTSVASAANAAAVEKNYQDGKDAVGTYYGKYPPYSTSEPFTPGLSNQSQTGSGGTQYSSLGVDHDPDVHHH